MAQRYWGSRSPVQHAAETHVHSDAHLPANCFTVGRFGDPMESIVMSLNRGPDEFRPWEPHVLVGGYRVHRDHRDGCFFEKHPDGKTAVVHRAVVNWVNPEGKRSFYTLKAPGAEKLTTTLVKISSALPFAKQIVVNNHELRLFAGVNGGTLVGRDGCEALVDLVEGEVVTVFYEDGGVRKFRRQGVKLEEYQLGNEEMLTERIQNAWTRLEFAEAIENDEKREKVVHAILAGMADILHLTTRFNGRGIGQKMRVQLLKEFFLELTPEALELCHRKVTAILHEVDSALIAMMRTGSFENAQAVSATVTNIADARAVRDQEAPLSSEEREAKRQANIQKAEAARVAKEARQAEFSADRKVIAAKKAEGRKRKPDGTKAKKKGRKQRGAQAA